MDKSTGSYNLLFCTAVFHVVPKSTEEKEGSVELGHQYKSSATVSISLSFLSSACILSATLVHYCLASFLMYESPLGFHAPKLLWS